MTVEYLVQVMNRSLRKVEETIDQVEIRTHMSQTDQRQIMQAVLELSDRIKLIEMHVDLNRKIEFTFTHEQHID
ncbi:hypothetical protein SAMN05518871_101180 [Psychrobacillus sp. OK028]|uniref:hypothetical protein n=1 Tax=Psychrobacillus sp. OK028 TaxID=1884359 RepID=UPI00088AF333|nr:hypothetical protein [Psychrobacillus sp. OK028]SDM42162.1 hypothetical protein SAMN05518871_101180 [Psychrobacillus sp. OK028]